MIFLWLIYSNLWNIAATSSNWRREQLSEQMGKWNENENDAQNTQTTHRTGRKWFAEDAVWTKESVPVANVAGNSRILITTTTTADVRETERFAKWLTATGRRNITV